MSILRPTNLGERDMNASRTRLTAIILTAGAIVIAAVLLITRPWQDKTGSTTPTPTPSPTVGGGDGLRLATTSAGGAAAQDASAVRIRLSAGQPEPGQLDRPLVAVGSELSAETIQAILARLPELTAMPGDTQTFRLPDESLPPPRPGQTIAEPFPPSEPGDAPDVVPSGPLEVLRYAPEGDVPLAPFISLTFNQPMVPLATVSQLAALAAPAEITPALPGVWHWLGTRTARFEYTGDVDRLPMATEYVVTVPAGTQSQTGGVLAQTVSWRFRTATPGVQTFYPQGGPQPLDPLFFVSFDQTIDPAVMLAALHVRAGGQDVSLRLADAAEIEADTTVSNLAQTTPAGRWLAFRTATPLASGGEDAPITVAVGPDAPSAEGRLTSARVETFNLYTYGPLRLTRAQCGWDVCHPWQAFGLDFSNPLDPDSFDVAQVSVEPALPDATVGVYGNNLTIQGLTQGRTTYTVRVAGTLRDVFGQTLGEPVEAKFEVGSAEPALSGPNATLVTLDPAAPRPTFSVYSINYDRLEVQLYAVMPGDWLAYLTYRQAYDRNQPPTPPGRLVLSDTIAVNGVDDALTETAIDLSPALSGAYGHVIVIVQPPASLFTRDQYRPIVQAWVQVTDIGLDAFVDHSQMLVWATALADGAPLSDVQIQLAGRSDAIAVGSDGTARFDLPGDHIQYLTALRGDDSALLPPADYYWSDGGWQRQPVTDEARWYIFDDRTLYRPGEEVHVKGWLRRVGGGQRGDVGLLQGSATVNYEVYDPQSNQLTSGSAAVSVLGGFDFTFTLSPNANLGYAWVNLSLIGSAGNQLAGLTASHSFQIQDFRRPEFEVSARNETTGPYFAGDYATVAVAANYYAGGPLPNADVVWTVTSQPGSYSPPDWPDFVFGTWRPWWLDYGPARYAVESSFPFGPQGEGGAVEAFTGMTDATGNHYLRLDFDAMMQPQPLSVLAEATVTDVNRQAWASTTTLLVHPADLYVGLRSNRYFVPQGTPLNVDIIVVDIDGQPVAGRNVSVRAARLVWQFRAGAWSEEESDAQTCELVSTEVPLGCTFTTDQGGEYRLTATITDAQGRVNQSQFTRWVSGGQRPPSRTVEQEAVTLIPNQATYQSGDVAEILVQAPFSPAQGLLTISRSGLVRSERFQMNGDATTLRVPIEEGYIPNVSIQVDLVGAAPRTADDGSPLADVAPRPAYASGQLNLDIPPMQRTLNVVAAPRQSRLAPGEETTIDVSVTQADGRPAAGAEVAVVVVDEAVLALTNYQLADPAAIFYQARDGGLSSYYGRSRLLLVDPRQLVAQDGGAGAPLATQAARTGVVEEAVKALPLAAEADTANSVAGEPIRVRSDFNPLALFAPSVLTDAQGQAQVVVRAPDNLTRYRVMVVAVAGEKAFGSAESTLTARLPLMLRPAAPRFLNFGDALQLPVVVQNQTDAPLEVDVVVTATNLTLTGASGRRVSVPANDRVEVRFPAAALNAGEARLQFAAVADAYADATVISLPVYTPATTEAFAVYGVVDEGAIAQPLTLLSGVYPQFGGLSIDTSATALQALSDAVLYLVDYPFVGSEQLASRILAVSALRPVLAAFSAENLPAPAALESAIRDDIARLEQLQNEDGGFPVWERNRESEPFYTIHAAHALLRARSEGFAVSAEVVARAQAYLVNIESHYPEWYANETRWSLSAYALYVRQLNGDSDRPKAARLLDEAGLDNLPLEAVAWLWQVLHGDPAYAAQETAILRLVNNRVVETAGAATFATDTSDQDYVILHSDRRSDGLLLGALIAATPDSDLIPKVVNGLLGHQVRGRWNNTQENVFILLALESYFRTYEAQTPDFVARLWLGPTYVGTQTYSGRTTDSHTIQVPMSYLQGAAGQDIIVSKEGVGRLYYRLGVRYAPTDLQLAPLDQGFVVQRAYSAVDDPADVYQDADGVWHIQAGARVRVNLTLVADSRRTHVALIDPLPAGLEIINPALAVSPNLPSNPADEARPFWWWWWTWYDHQNLRDEQAEVFATLLWGGVYDYSYVARATTPGVFVTPPARAEEMYAPEVFGRSASLTVVVEDVSALPSSAR